MGSDAHDAGAELERFRAYLHLLARLGLDPRLRGKVDLSDVVQDTFLDAVRNLETFQRLNETEKAAWLRTVLANNLKDTIARLRAAKRDVQRERSLEAALDASSARLEAWLTSTEASPCQTVIRHEDQLRLAWAVEQLPEARRTAVELHSLQGYTLAETAEFMGKTKTAVAQLVSRGIKDLHDLLRDE